MNKKLVVLAVAGAFASPLAVQAQTANVTLYGILNLDLEFLSGKQADGSNPTVNRVSSNSSRFGLRGTESLGGGLNAIFQIESNVSADTGNAPTSGLASRDSFVGLQGSWGTMKLGHFLTPYIDVHSVFGNAPTLQTSVLATYSVWSNGLDPSNGGYLARPGNSIRYDSPKVSGFTGSVQYATRDSSGALNGETGDHPSELRHAYTLALGGTYNNGPLQIAATYEARQKLRAANLDDKAFTIAGGYDFGTIMQGFGLRLGGVYERLKYDTPTGDLRRDFWGVSGTIPAGGGKVYLFWGHAGNGMGSASDSTFVGNIGHGSQTKTDMWEASYSYNLSPRTLLYAGYVRINNDARARYTFAIGPYPIAPGGKPAGAVFGIAHFF